MGIPFHQPGSWAELTYTTIEAGKIGGRRDELVLTQRRQVNKILPRDEDESAELDHEATEEEIITDAAYVASLLSKANALIQRIENPPPPPFAKDQQVKAQAQPEKVDSRLEESGRGLKVLRVKSQAEKGRIRKIKT